MQIDVVVTKYKRAEGYDPKEQSEGGGDHPKGRSPATNCGRRGIRGGGRGCLEPRSQGRGAARVPSLSTAWARTTRGTINVHRHTGGGAGGLGRRNRDGEQFQWARGMMGRTQQGGLTRVDINYTLVETITLSRHRVEKVYDRGLWEAELGVLIDHELNI